MREEIFDELKDEVDNGKACIVFDFGCYFPYEEKNLISFDFQVGDDKFSDIKLNRRYPNKQYITISKKSERRVSKIGYPYFIEMNKFDNGPMDVLLSVNLGVNDSKYYFTFPMRIELSKEKPVCALELRLNFEKLRFTFSSSEPVPDDIGWYMHHWSNDPSILENWEKNTVIFDTPTRLNEFTIMYSDVIAPIPCVLDRLAII